MSSKAEHSFQEFIDAIELANDEVAFEQVAARTAQRLGFRCFAYLRLVADQPTLISSYPKSWTNRYFSLSYQKLDPVVRRARREHDLFAWGGDGPRQQTGSQEQRRFFEEATTFGIRSGVTIPIRSGFGRMAAFTLATDESAQQIERLTTESRDVLQLVGLYFHTHVTTKLSAQNVSLDGESVLTQRQRQCLAWAARGKTMADTALLTGISPRTVVFHLETARRKLEAASIAQCVAEAMRRGLLP
jgi:LuxR family transcriptional activator of conjugal transfer of Ti plasmids